MAALSMTFSDANSGFQVILQFDGEVRQRMLNMVLPSGENWQVICIL